ncbi:MAG: FAD:protein FMN transferase, partial [Treponema sp.]|nr:FAD:protein FMN transferase [Treponema sp.]
MNFPSALDYKNIFRFTSFLAAVFSLNLVLTACSRPEFSRAEFVLGTICSVTLYDQGSSRIYNEIFSRIREIENVMSVKIPASNISRVNASAGIAPVQVHEDLYKVIERALYFAKLSGVAFDPTVGPLVSLWDIMGENPRVPLQTEIEEILPLIAWQDIELDFYNNSVFLKRTGMALDLGGIAKGYAADEAAVIIKRAGITQAIIDLGGNIITLGIKKDKTLWRVGIQNPNGQRGEFA